MNGILVIGLDLIKLLKELITVGLKPCELVNRELKKVGQDRITCIGTTVFRNGTQVVVTTDCVGNLCIYRSVSRNRVSRNRSRMTFKTH